MKVSYTSSMKLDTEFSTLQISDVTIQLSERSNKWVQSIDICIDEINAVGEFERMGSTETARQAKVRFKPPRVAVVSLQVTARLRYKNFLKSAWKDHEFKIQAEELRAVQHRSGGRKEWRRDDAKLSVVVGLTNQAPSDAPLIPGNASIVSAGFTSSDESRLTPTTEGILRDCPRFRILVMGKTGVGKSRLINKTFGVDDAIVAHHEVGDANIDKEILSKDNPHFILHDSKGFEHGDDLNVKAVHRFVTERGQAPLLKDKLHAIWLCMDIPTNGGRLLESGIEDFLKLKVHDKLGHVPVIAIFTKYDRLVLKLKRALRSSHSEGLPKDEFDQLLQEKVKASMQELCVGPFEEFVGKKIPWIAVSSEPSHEPRLAELIQLTFDHVREHFADAAVVTAMAQRVSPRVNIQASIAVGRRKYWERLATSVHFRKKTMKECLDVIHADIIAVWRFNDPHNYLSSKEFKALISNLSPQQSGQPESPPDMKRNLAASVSLLAGIAGIVGALAGPLCPIVLPIAATVVLGKWAYDVYQQTTDALRHLMEYIIDLTLVLQNVFWLQALLSSGRPLSRRHIKAAANSYLASNARQTLRFEIDKHIHTIKFNLGPDTTLETIIRLIESSTIDTEEAFGQRMDISRYGDVFAEETYAEEWDAGQS